VENPHNIRILLYNDECSLCRLLATTIHELSDNKISIKPLNNEKAMYILNKFYPNGHPYTYYLIEKIEGYYKIKRGFSAGINIFRIIGPLKFIQIIKILIRVGGVLLLRNVSSTRKIMPCPCPR
jgi:hypothetical protein